MSITRRQNRITRKLETVFAQPQAAVLGEVITDAYNDLVKTDDFNELKAIVKDLAQAQGELVQAQSRTERRMEELVQAQKSAQIEIEKLGIAVRETNSHVGGLSQSVAYALENEAYRMLPALLKKQYGIEISDKLIRTIVEGEEINILGKGTRNGQDVILTGETKLWLDERRQKKHDQPDVFTQLANKARAVRKAHPDIEIVPLLIYPLRPSGYVATGGRTRHYCRAKF